jgi:hypothetical protein
MKMLDTEDSFLYPLEGCTEDTEEEQQQKNIRE